MAMVILALVIASLAAYAGIGLEWVERDIRRGSIDRWSPMVTDSEGNIHVAYSTSGLSYAVRKGSGWTTEVVASSSDYPFSYPPIRDISLAVDDHGVCHIISHATWKSDTSAILYSTDRLGSWSTRVLDVGSFGEKTAIAVDSTSCPHVAYSEDCALKYATLVEYNWTKWTVMEADHYGPLTKVVLPEIVVDSSDNPTIVFLNSYRRMCLYTNLTGEIEEWTYRTSSTEGISTIVSERLSAWIGTDDDIHVIWVETSSSFNGTALLAHAVVQDWEPVFFNSTLDEEFCAELDRVRHSVAIDSEGHLHIVMNTFWSVEHIWWSDDNFVGETIDGVEDRSELDSILISRVWIPDIAATFDGGDNLLISRPYGSPGYYSNDPTLLDRIAESTPILILFGLMASALTIAYISLWKYRQSEKIWQDALRDDDVEGR